MKIANSKNSEPSSVVKKGEEKGFFEYGGSTIILLFQKNAAQLMPEYSGLLHRDQKNMISYVYSITRADWEKIRV